MLFKWAIWGSVAVLSFGVFGPAEGAEGKIGGLAFAICVTATAISSPPERTSMKTVSNSGGYI